MICKSHAIYCLHLLCSLLLSLCSCLHYCAARDTITARNPINNTSNETLISDGKRFELRFLNISGQSSSRYVGVGEGSRKELENSKIFEVRERSWKIRRSSKILEEQLRIL
ncbi:hypothetical protein CsSME_00027144 [Camellia sinensis var. sinensis]